MSDLTYAEAERLSVYFEELTSYHRKEAKKLQSQSSTTSGLREESTVEFVIGDDDFDTSDYSEFLDDDEDE